MGMDDVAQDWRKRRRVGESDAPRDRVQEELVRKVKDFQKLGEDEKNICAQYCNEKAGGTRDPAKHDVPSLQDFCRIANISYEGIVPASDPEKDELVRRIKDFQRASEQQKEQWHTFCESKGNIRDPARHTVDTLRYF